MPALRNPRHELFAQGLAKGLTLTEAYVAAGYDRYPSAASRLSKNLKVHARAAEIRDAAAARSDISVGVVTENLIRIAGKAEAVGGAPGLNVARAVWMDAAKLNRLMEERKGKPGEGVLVLSGEPMSEEEWFERFGAGAAEAE